MDEDLEIKMAKIVGTSQKNHWSQAFSQSSFYAVVAVQSGEEEAALLGKKILDSFSLVQTDFKKKNLVEFKNFFASLTAEIPSPIQVTCAASLIWGKVCYLGVKGQGVIFLKRGGKVAIILAEEKTASGFLAPDDFLILTTQPLLNLVGEANFKKLLVGLSPQEIGENLAPLVHQGEASGLAAALILGFFGKKALEEEKPKVLPKGRNFFPSIWLGQIFSPVNSPFLLLKNFFSNFSPPSFSLKLKTSEERPRRLYLTVALFLVALLAVSLFFGFQKREQTEKRKKFTELFNLASQKYEEGQALIGLNDFLARQNLREAQKQTEVLKREFPKVKSAERKKTEALTQKISEGLTQALRIYQISPAAVFWDLNLVREGAWGTKLALYKKTLALFDEKNQALYTLSLKTKAAQVVAGGATLAQGKLLAIHGERLFLLTPEGILVVNTSEKIPKLMIKGDQEWGEIQDLAAYAGNLYLLDKDKNQIWKYQGSEGGFAEKTHYLGKGLTLDFSGAKEMAIDGAIWILAKKNIFKYTLGRPESFSLRGLEEELVNPRALFTDEESQNLYILDPEGKRMVVLDKKGEYVAQYQWEGLAEAQDLVVSESEKKILILVGSKIYGIEIK